MKTLKHLIYIYIIAFLFFSCAPLPENTTAAIDTSNNFIAIGLYHGFISPVAVVGKILGLNIGLYDAGKDGISYWLGYLLGLIVIGKIIFFRKANNK